MPETIHGVIIHHAARLHKCVTNCRAHELEAAFFQVFAHGVGLRCSSRNLLVCLPEILEGRAADELPQVVIETSELFLHFEEGLRVGHGGGDFEAIADDAGVLQ